MRVSVHNDQGGSDTLPIQDLEAFVAQRRLPLTIPVLIEGSVEAVPAELLINPPPGYTPLPYSPTQLALLFIVEDSGRMWGPYREETIRAMASKGYFSFKARAGPVYTSERWLLFKLMSLGVDFRQSRDRLLANRRNMFIGRMIVVYLLFFSIPTWLAGFAGSGEAAATAALLNLISIYIASRSIPL